MHKYFEDSFWVHFFEMFRCNSELQNGAANIRVEQKFPYQNHFEKCLHLVANWPSSIGNMDAHSRVKHI
jgi:hypothetical protein